MVADAILERRTELTDGDPPREVTAAFDGGTISSDGGVFLLASADERLGLIDALARLFTDDRDSAQISHSIADMLRARVFTIACGYADCNDFDTLRAGTPVSIVATVGPLLWSAARAG